MAAGFELLAAGVVAVVAVLAGWPGAASGQGVEWEDVGEGVCVDADGNYPNYHYKYNIATESACKALCAKVPVCAGINYEGSSEWCTLYGTGLSEATRPGPDWSFSTGSGTDDLVKASGAAGYRCLKKKGEPPLFSTHYKGLLH